MKTSKIVKGHEMIFRSWLGKTDFDKIYQKADEADKEKMLKAFAPFFTICWGVAINRLTRNPFRETRMESGDRADKQNVHHDDTKK